MSVEEAQKQQAQDQKAQALQVQYNKYQEDISEFQSHLAALASKIQEQVIVDNTLSSIAPTKREGRRCFKLIGGVLVEKSVDEVIQMLHNDLKGMKQEQEKFQQELARMKKDMEAWMTKNNIKIVSK
ncbi:Prefoldin subunit 2 [Meyerozyma sp. JA9]|nr:Prefoldin subunit 2 [Meyerozyma sp. JA9]